MQINAKDIHKTKYPEDDKGDTASNNKARANSQAQKADGENNDNCLSQCRYEIADRFLDHLWLVRNLIISSPTGKSCLILLIKSDRLSPSVNILPPDSIDTAMPIAGSPLKNIFGSAGSTYLRSTVAISPSRKVCPLTNRQAANRFYVIKHSRDAQIHIIGLRLDHPGRRDFILGFYCTSNCLCTDAQLCQLAVFYLNINFSGCSPTSSTFFTLSTPSSSRLISSARARSSS